MSFYYGAANGTIITINGVPMQNVWGGGGQPIAWTHDTPVDHRPCSRCAVEAHATTDGNLHEHEQTGRLYCTRCRDIFIADAAAHNARILRAQAAAADAQRWVWIGAAFAAMAPDRRADLYRALSRVLHPDQGGSEAAMTALNLARERFAA